MALSLGQGYLDSKYIYLIILIKVRALALCSHVVPVETVHLADGEWGDRGRPTSLEFCVEHQRRGDAQSEGCG